MLCALPHMDMSILSFAREARTHRIGGHCSSMPYESLSMTPFFPLRWRSAGQLFAAIALIFSLSSVGFPAHANNSALTAASVEFARDWVVTPQAAFDLIKQGALVIDARASDLKRKNGEIKGAVSLVWQDLSEPNLPTKGRPLPVDQASKKLQALGVTKDRAIVVVADAVNGWGEDGRITWLLRNWGHGRVVLADGGLAALEKLGSLTIKPAAAAGDFVAKESSLEIKKEEVKAKLDNKDVVFLDVREPREFDGKTPYGESRGGHLAPAKHLFFKDLLDKEGRLLTRAEIEKLLASKGVTRDKEVVSYCTGGIRAGWVTAVLNDMGYKARNYAGSMWEWSAQSAAEFPLQKN